MESIFLLLLGYSGLLLTTVIGCYFFVLLFCRESIRRPYLLSRGYAVLAVGLTLPFGALLIGLFDDTGALIAAVFGAVSPVVIVTSLVMLLFSIAPRPGR
jgi:hypothetical protein